MSNKRTFVVGQRVQVARKIYDEGVEYDLDENLERIFVKCRIPFTETSAETSAVELESLKLDELRELADKRDLDHKGLKKAELVELLRGEVTRILSDSGEDEESDELDEDEEEKVYEGGFDR